jgi:hypothetical protein
VITTCRFSSGWPRSAYPEEGKKSIISHAMNLRREKVMASRQSISWCKISDFLNHRIDLFTKFHQFGWNQVGFVKQEFENVCEGKQFINFANENCFVAGSRHWWCGGLEMVRRFQLWIDTYTGFDYRVPQSQVRHQPKHGCSFAGIEPQLCIQNSLHFNLPPLCETVFVCFILVLRPM